MQNKFYGKFVKAIRAAGYQGPLCGSPWQAPAMVPHYYNLRSDYLVGWIDRHNYFGGELNDTMLARPGSGYLGSGLQQVADRPFGISEWIHVYPSLYSAEGPAIFAAYGMGLQGWALVVRVPVVVEPRGLERDRGQLPLGRVERRHAHADRPVPAPGADGDARRCHGGADHLLAKAVPRGVAAGQFRFSDKIEQHGDMKNFAGTVPPEALAAGRVVVEFTAKPEPSTLPDMRSYEKDKVITSATGQLRWDYSEHAATLPSTRQGPRRWSVLPRGRATAGRRDDRPCGAPMRRCF